MWKVIHMEPAAPMKRAATMAQNTVRRFRGSISSIIFRALEAVPMTKTRMSAAQTWARERFITAAGPIREEPTPWITRSPAIIGQRTTARPASVTTRVIPMKIRTATSRKSRATHKGVPMCQSQAVMTAVPPRAPATAPR